MTRLILLTLLLAWASPVAADVIRPYEYEFVVVSAPVTLTGPGYVEVTLRLPVEGLMGQVYLKSCEPWGGPPIVDDEYVHMHVIRRHPDHYFTRVKIADLMPGRTQTYCPRLPYWPWHGGG